MVNAFAIFGQTNYDLSPRVEVSFALRYDRDDRELTIMAPQQYLPVFPFPSGNEGDVREEVFDAWQPKATVRWKPNDAVAVYGVYAQGFRSGGFNLSGVAAGRMRNDLPPDAVRRRRHFEAQRFTSRCGAAAPPL